MPATIQWLLAAPMPGKESYSILSYRQWTSTLTSIPRKGEEKAIKRAETRQKKKKKKKEKTPTTKTAGTSNELERT
jgi:hypothetical protein